LLGFFNALRANLLTLLHAFLACFLVAFATLVTFLATVALTFFLCSLALVKMSLMTDVVAGAAVGWTCLATTASLDLATFRMSWSDWNLEGGTVVVVTDLICALRSWAFFKMSTMLTPFATGVVLVAFGLAGCLLGLISLTLCS